MAKMNGKSPEQLATETSNRFQEAKVQAIAEKLNVTYAEAAKLVEQEQKRKEYGKRYRESESYKKRLEQQKLVRAMLKQ